MSSVKSVVLPFVNSEAEMVASKEAPQSLTTRTNCHRTGELVGGAAVRRRDADACDRDGRAP
jgi:hypothetical protein